MVKKRFIFISCLGALFIMMVFSGCSGAGVSSSDVETDLLVETPLESTQSWSMWDAMNYYKTSVWNKADWTNGGMFNCGWVPENVYFSSGKLVLKLNNAWAHDKPYSAGEYRTDNEFSYGYFETNMKAVSRTGTVTAFFLYTGSPWDEIDFEILGKDPTQVQLNYFVSGVGGHEKIIDLDFNASTGYHKYGIEYGNGYINWYIDGDWVYGVNNTGFNASYGAAMPSNPMQIMVNHWPGTGVDVWLGSYSNTSTTYAYYDYILYRTAR